MNGNTQLANDGRDERFIAYRHWHIAYGKAVASTVSARIAEYVGTGWKHAIMLRNANIDIAIRERILDAVEQAVNGHFYTAPDVQENIFKKSPGDCKLRLARLVIGNPLDPANQGDLSSPEREKYRDALKKIFSRAATLLKGYLTRERIESGCYVKPLWRWFK